MQHIIDNMKSNIEQVSEISGALLEFVKNHPGLLDGDAVVGTCTHYSRKFIKTYPQLNAILVHLVGYRTSRSGRSKHYAAYPNPDPDMYHTVVLINNLVCDFTQRQFDHRAVIPHTSSWNELVAEWCVIAHDDIAIEDELCFRTHPRTKDDYVWWEDKLRSNQILLTGTIDTNPHIANFEMLKATYGRSKIRAWFAKFRFWRK